MCGLIELAGNRIGRRMPPVLLSRTSEMFARKLPRCLIRPVTPACKLPSMGDDASYTPGRAHPTARVVPRPAEPLWELRKDHVTYTCELRYHGEWGVEARFCTTGNSTSAGCGRREPWQSHGPTLSGVPLKPDGMTTPPIQA